MKNPYVWGYKKAIRPFDVKHTERVHCPQAAQWPGPTAWGWLLSLLSGRATLAERRGVCGPAEVVGCLLDAST